MALAADERELLDEDAREADIAQVLPQHHLEDEHQLIEEGRVGDFGECALDGVAHFFLEHHYKQRFLRFGMEEKRALGDVGGRRQSRW